MHYNKFPNLGVYHANFFPIWKAIGSLQKLQKNRCIVNLFEILLQNQGVNYLGDKTWATQVQLVMILRPNKNTCRLGNPTLPKFTGETKTFFSSFLKKKIYAFWKAKCLSKCIKLYIFFFLKKIIKKICAPTLPKIFRFVTWNTLVFLFGLIWS